MFNFNPKDDKKVAIGSLLLITLPIWGPLFLVLVLFLL